MIARDFKEANIKIAESQPEYATLPAKYTPGPEGIVTVSFKLTDKEYEQVMETGTIYLQFLTFNRNFQPIACTCLNPFIDNKTE
jgi:hypothetical protein